MFYNNDRLLSEVEVISAPFHRHWGKNDYNIFERKSREGYSEFE